MRLPLRNESLHWVPLRLEYIVSASRTTSRLNCGRELYSILIHRALVEEQQCIHWSHMTNLLGQLSGSVSRVGYGVLARTIQYRKAASDYIRLMNCQQATAALSRWIPEELSWICTKRMGEWCVWFNFSHCESDRYSPDHGKRAYIRNFKFFFFSVFN